MNTNTTDQPTLITLMAAAMTNHTTEQLLEIIDALRDSRDTNERIIKFGAYEVLEARYPAIVPMLEEWCSDVEDDRTYETMAIDAVRAIISK